MFFLNKHETNLKFFVHDRQNQLNFQRQLFTADRSRYVVNDFCSRKMKSYKSVNLISIKVPDTQIYLKTTNRGFLNEYETSSKVCVHDGQNRLSFQRQLFTADRSRYVVNDFCSRKMKSYKSVNLISIKVPDTQIYLKTTNRGFLNEYETSSNVCVHDGQNRLSFQRQLFTTDRSRYVVNDFCSRKMKS